MTSKKRSEDHDGLRSRPLTASAGAPPLSAARLSGSARLIYASADGGGARPQAASSGARVERPMAVPQPGEPVGEHQVTALGQHRLGVELHALDRQGAVAHRHHDAGVGPAGDLDLVRQRRRDHG